MKKILVTGGAGYIGSLLIPYLIKKGHIVTNIDSHIFKGFYPLENYKHTNYKFVKCDIRDEDYIEYLFRGMKFNTIIHLAALVGEPLCKSVPELAKEINLNATKSLVNLSKKYSIYHFIFASTCSNYGISKNKFASETSSLKPLSLYSETKIQSENYVMTKANKNFFPTILRFATVFGVSPRMRFDLLINELVRDAFCKKEINLYNPSGWRPFVHISDAVRALEMSVSAPLEITARQIFNVGGDGGNIRKIDIASILKEFLPNTEIILTQGKDVDLRNYRVSFKKIKDTLHYSTYVTIKKGIEEIIEALNSSIFNHPYDDIYRNVLKKESAYGER